MSEIVSIVIGIAFAVIGIAFFASPILSVVALLLHDRPFAIKMYFISAFPSCVVISMLLERPVSWFLLRFVSSVFGMRAYISDDGSAITYLLSLFILFVAYKLGKKVFH